MLHMVVRMVIEHDWVMPRAGVVHQHLGLRAYAFRWAQHGSCHRPSKGEQHGKQQHEPDTDALHSGSGYHARQSGLFEAALDIVNPPAVTSALHLLLVPDNQRTC